MGLTLTTLIMLAGILTPTVGANAQSFVVGGEPVDPGSYPWMAAIVRKHDSDTFDGHFCGGSLVSKNYVLTAAHCVSNELGVPKNLQLYPYDVVLATTVLGERVEPALRIAVKNIIVHPDYDVALLKLERDTTVKPIQIVAPGTRLAAPGTMATVTGWGQTTQNGDRSKTLMKVTVPIVSSPVCKRAYSVYDGQHELCAGLKQGGKDACKYDSGGPLFVKRRVGQRNRFMQVGIVSYGRGCALPEKYGVYERVSAAYDWVVDTINRGGVQSPAPEYNFAEPEWFANFSMRCDGLYCKFKAKDSIVAGDFRRYIWRIDETTLYGRETEYTFDRPGQRSVSLTAVQRSDGEKYTIVREFQIQTTGAKSLLGTAKTGSWVGNVETNGRTYIPDRQGFEFAGGKLSVKLSYIWTLGLLMNADHLGLCQRRDFDIYLQKLNESARRWELVPNTRDIGAATRCKLAVDGPISTPPDDAGRYRTDAGRYRLVVMARGGEGLFRINTARR